MKKLSDHTNCRVNTIIRDVFTNDIVKIVNTIPAHESLIEVLCTNDTIISSNVNRYVRTSKKEKATFRYKHDILTAITELIKIYGKNEYTGRFPDCPLCSKFRNKVYSHSIECDVVDHFCTLCPNIVFTTKNKKHLTCIYRETYVRLPHTSYLIKNAISFWTMTYEYLNNLPISEFTNNLFYKEDVINTIKRFDRLASNK